MQVQFFQCHQLRLRTQYHFPTTSYGLLQLPFHDQQRMPVVMVTYSLRAVYLDDEGRCPTFSSVDEALEYAAAHSIDYTNTGKQLEHWRADVEERAALGVR